MNKTLQLLIAGIVGMTVGSVITYKISENKCWAEQMQLAQIMHENCQESLKSQMHCKVMMEKNNWCKTKGVKYAGTKK